MVSFRRIPSPPFSAELVDQLKGLEALYHPDPESDGFAQLKAVGVNLLPLPEGSITEGTVLVPSATGPLERLNQIAVRLLGEGGCPWDRSQTHASLKKYLLEESYELFQAIDDEDRDGMIEELGDVLLQPLMHAEMARIEGNFSLDDVCGGITSKLIRRHPHVFGDVKVADESEVLKNWDKIKKQEKQDQPGSLLSGVPKSLPALYRAFEISKRAARAGFEWQSQAEVWLKFEEERAEYDEAKASGDKEAIQSELGDLLFTLVNIARHDHIDPEGALQSMINRFSARFQAMEAIAEKPLDELSAADWDELWNKAKAAERPVSAP